MDVISLGKANKSIKEKKEYISDFLGKDITSHFKTLDERIDWIKKQYDENKAENIIDLLIKNGTFNDTEIIDGKLRLKGTSIQNANVSEIFPNGGTYESTFDFGDNFISSNSVEIITKIASNHSMNIEFSESEDGITFSNFKQFTTTDYPQKRFCKIKIKLSSNDVQPVEYTNETILEDNPYIENGKMKKELSYQMEKDNLWNNDGVLFKKTIYRDKLLRIDKIGNKFLF